MFGFIVLQRANQPMTPEERVAFNRQLYYSLTETEGAQLIPIEPVMAGAEGDLVISPFWPYGLESNQGALEQFSEYAYQQGLTSRPLTIEELFPAALLD
jgi:hypothetical protein